MNILSLLWFLISLLGGVAISGYCFVELDSDYGLGERPLVAILFYPLSIPVCTYLAAKEKLNKCGAILAAVFVTVLFSIAVILVAIIAYGIMLPGYLAVKLFCAIFAKRSD